MSSRASPVVCCAAATIERSAIATARARMPVYPARGSGWRVSMHFHRWRRREFITLLGGAAAWPVASLAQQPSKIRRIGFLGTSTSAVMSQWTAAFVQRLRELGWVEGRDIAIEYRYAEGRNERFAEIAAEFVELKLD